MERPLYFIERDRDGLREVENIVELVDEGALGVFVVVYLGMGSVLLGLLLGLWWDLQGSKIGYGSKRKGSLNQLKVLACGKNAAVGLLSGHVKACSISAGGECTNANCCSLSCCE